MKKRRSVRQIMVELEVAHRRSSVDPEEIASTRQEIQRLREELTEVRKSRGRAER